MMRFAINMGRGARSVARRKRGVRLVLAAVVAHALLFVTLANAATVRLAYFDSSKHRGVVEALKEEFEASQIGAELALVPVSEGQARIMLPMWLATGEIADVFYLPVEYVGALRGNQLFMPLETLRWPGSPLHVLFSQFPPGLQAAFADRQLPIGIPLTASASLFQYNENLLADAGVPALDEFSTEWTWYDLIDVGRRVSAPFQNRYMLDIDLEFTGVYFMVHGGLVKSDGVSSNVLNEANVKILELAREAIYQHRISPLPSMQNQEQRRFSTQLLALNKASIEDLHPARLAEARSRLPFSWNMALAPRSPFSGGRPALGEGAGLVVAWGARSLLDVSTLLDFAARPDVQLKIAQKAGVIPAAPQALPGLWSGASSAASLAAHVLLDWQFFTFPVLLVMADAEALLAPIQAALNDMMEPEDALEQIHIQFQGLLDSMYKSD